MSRPSSEFWKTKRLDQMSPDEWEALCDGCGKCCLIKLRDQFEDVHYTDVACHLFDRRQCRCRDYTNRRKHVPDCVQVTPEAIHSLGWMPHSCAYRRLAEGRGLAWWHPLVSGDPMSVIAAGQSAAGRTHCETGIDEEDLVDYIVTWPAGDAPDQR